MFGNTSWFEHIGFLSLTQFGRNVIYCFVGFFALWGLTAYVLDQHSKTTMTDRRFIEMKTPTTDPVDSMNKAAFHYNMTIINKSNQYMTNVNLTAQLIECYDGGCEQADVSKIHLTENIPPHFSHPFEGFVGFQHSQFDPTSVYSVIWKIDDYELDNDRKDY